MTFTLLWQEFSCHRILNSDGRHIQTGSCMLSISSSHNRGNEETSVRRQVILIVLLLTPFLGFIFTLVLMSGNATATQVLTIIAIVTVMGVVATILRGFRGKPAQLGRPEPLSSARATTEGRTERPEDRLARVSKEVEEQRRKRSGQHEAIAVKPMISFKRLRGSMPETPEWRATDQETIMIRFCWRCGRSVAEGASYCDLCGTDLKEG